MPKQNFHRQVCVSMRGNRFMIGLYWVEAEGSMTSDLKDRTVELFPKGNNIAVEETLKRMVGGRWEIMFSPAQFQIIGRVTHAMAGAFDLIVKSADPLSAIADFPFGVSDSALVEMFGSSNDGQK